MSPWEALGSQDTKYQNNIYEHLVTPAYDGSKMEGQLAESWEISEDGLTYTFKLRPNLKFSDGSDVTEEDWQWSFYRARDYQGSNALTRSEMIDTVSMPEKDTLVITLKYPCPPFISYCSSYNLVVASKKHFDEVGEEEFIQNPMGTGPYFMTEWKRNEHMYFEANPYYWNEGEPKTKYLKYEIVSDENTRYLQLQGGKIDLAPMIPNTMMAQVEADPNLHGETFPSTQIRTMVLNTTIAPFNDPKVREALRYATDKQEIANIVALGYAKPVASSIPSAHGDFFNKNIKDPDVDFEKAKQMLIDAGYTPGQIGATINVSASQAIYTDIATVLKSQWAKAGFELTIEPLESATLSEKTHSLTHQACIYQWTDGGTDPASLLGFICDYTESSHWYTGLDDKDLEAMYWDSQKEINYDKRVQLINEMQEIIYAEHCIIPIFQADYTYGVSDKIQGLNVSNGNRVNTYQLLKTK